MLSSPRNNGKTHGNKTTPGIGFPQINKTVVEREKEDILNQYAGAGYGINLIFDETTPPSSGLSPEDIDSHILGVILASQYNLKKGTELFGERADEAVTNELSEIDDLETHKPQRIEDLTYEDKNRHLNRSYLFWRKGPIKMVKKKLKVDVWQLVASNVPTMDMKNPMGGLHWSSPTAFFSQVSLTLTKTEGCLR